MFITLLDTRIFSILYELSIHTGDKDFQVVIYIQLKQWDQDRAQLRIFYSEIGAIFRILSGRAISLSQDPEPEFKGYLVSVASVCQRAHYTRVHMILHIFRLWNVIKKEE